MAAMGATLAASAAHAGDVTSEDSTLVRAERNICAPGAPSFARAAEAIGGVHSQVRGDRLGRVLVRGMGPQRVGVISDGMPELAMPAGDLDGIATDPARIAAIQWLAGVASLRYGSDPITGVMRLESFEPPAAGGVSDGAGLERSGGDAAIGAHLHTSGAKGRWGWQAAGAGIRADQDSWRSTNAGGGDAALRFAGATASTQLRWAHDQGNYKTAWSSFDNPNTLDRDVTADRVALASRLRVQDIDLQLRTQWQHRTFDATDVRDVEELRSAFDAWSAELAGRRDVGRLGVTAGISGLAQANDERGPRPLLPNAHTVAGAAFALADARVGEVALSGGVRADVRHIEVDESVALVLPNDQRGFRDWSGSLSAAWQVLQGTTLSLQGARTWRPPNVEELYSRGVPSGSDHLESGGRSLDAERGYGAEAGIDSRLARARASVRGWWRRVDDYIELTPGAYLAPYRYVAREARLTGGEARIAVDIVRELSVDGRLDYASGQDVTNDRPLSGIPQPRWGLGAQCHSHALHDGGMATARFELEGYGRRTRPGALDRATVPATFVHAGVEMAWPLKRGTLRAGFAVRNITDRFDELSSTASSPLGIGEGRSLQLRIGAER